MSNLLLSAQPRPLPLVDQQDSLSLAMRGRKRARSISDLDFDNDLMPSVVPAQPSRGRRRKRAKPSGPAFDATPSETDIHWIDLPENQPAPGQFRSGPPADPLARMITRPCYPSGQEPRHDNRYFRCIASSVCGWRQKNWDRQLPRIYKHAARCSALHRWKPALSVASETALANMAPGGFQPASTIPEPPELSVDRKPSLSPSSVNAIVPDSFAKFDSTTLLTQAEKLDHAIAQLICASGSPARLVDYPEWSLIFSLANPDLDYSPPLSSYLRDTLIPAEVQRAVLHMRDYLRTQRNLSLSFDGLTAGEQPVYTIHICTAERVTFLYRADIFYGSHNSDYMLDLLQQVINEIGVQRFASVVSDDTNTTKKARRLLADLFPSVLNLADPIHKMNACIQDICLDQLSSTDLQRLRKLLTHFKMSTYATGKLNTARKTLGILRGLQSIGNTRFATLYYAATSVLDNLPALYKIYRENQIDTVGTPLPAIVAEAINELIVTAIKFKLMLTELVNILEPFARALLCLESTQSTLADVYFFWLGALASLNWRFTSNGSILTPEEKSRIVTVVSKRFNEAINDAPTDSYLTAFFLDPRYRSAAIYASSDELQIQPVVHTPYDKAPFVSHSRLSKRSSRLTETFYMRIRKHLLSMLRSELQAAESLSEHPLHAYSNNALDAKEQLCEQLDVYYRSERLPFRRASNEHQPAIQYWQLQKEFPQTFLLAYLAEKLFAVLPNSMCDERAGSRLTHLYSKLRTRLDAKTMIEQIQFMQWNKLTQGASPVTTKVRLTSRFEDIPRTELPEAQPSTDHSEILAALSDEVGDSWLDSPSVPAAPLTSSAPLAQACFSLGKSGIDLTSNSLVSLLGVSCSFDTPEAGVQEESRSKGDTSPRIIRAADVSWD